MALVLHHVFIMSAPGAPEAEALIQRGFLEGSRSAHPGQGTSSRRFFFDNFMLELLWVEDPSEAQSAQTRRTRLWDRWAARERANPFGILFSAQSEPVASAPFPAWDYQPPYLQPGARIEIAEGTHLQEPELSYVPHPRATGLHGNEPITRIGTITGVSVGLPGIAHLSAASQRAREAGLLTYFESVLPVLEVHFLSAAHNVIDLRPILPLIFRGVSGRHPK